MRRTVRAELTVAAAAAALLSACGGGGALDDSLSQEVAQGYAADAATMPVSATGGLDSATSALESALGTAAAAGAPVDSGRMQALAVAQASGSAQCLRGGSLAWSVTGGTPEQQNNGQLDAGETFTVTYTGCAADDDTVIDGSFTLAVASAGGGKLDVTHTATAFQVTNAKGRYVLDGSLRHQRSSITTPVGGMQVTGRWTSTRVTLSSTTGTRQASYELKTLDWNVSRVYDSAGRLTMRTHQGTLDLAANTPRRPAATLTISTQGTLTVSSDGFAGSGSFTVRTSRDTIACTYGNGTAVLTLDRGNDGTIDRTWTLQRAEFIDQAG